MRPCYPASLHGETGAGAFLEIHPQPRPDLLVQVAFEVLAPSLGGDFAQAQHVDVLGHLHYAAHVVVHEQYGHALRGEQIDPVIHLGGDPGREADARLVDEAQPRAQNVGLGELDHFLLTSGEIARLGAQLLPDRREVHQHFVDARPYVELLRVRARQVLERQAQVVGHAHVGKQARLLRDVPDAAIDEPVRGDAGHVGAVVTDGSRLRAQKTAEGLHQRGLACAVQADEPGDSARLHAERDVAQDIDVGGVAGGDGGHFEQRAHAAASSSPPRYASITERSFSTVRVGPSAMTAPAFMQIVRGQSSTITGMSWLTTRNVCPPAWCARMKRAIVSFMDGCTAAKGSSRSAIFGGDMKQQPNSRSFCWPPESCPASRSLTRESVSSSRRSPARASAPACARPRARPAVIRLSSALMRRNTRVSWNIRCRPRAAMRSGLSPWMASSSSRTSPDSAGWCPERMFNRVVLPEPFGPMRPTSSPRPMSKLTRSTARRPPKARDTLETARQLTPWSF